jgi:uncharacterized protein
MLYLFQRKMIYLPYAPPGARAEKIEPRTHIDGLDWEQVEMSTSDGANLAGLLVAKSGQNHKVDQPALSHPGVVIIYLQGTTF